MTSMLPPGPAFIPYPGTKPEDCEGYRFLYKVPAGYIWQPATESTGAGWVRPRACDHHWIGGNDGSWCTKCKEERT